VSAKILIQLMSLANANWILSLKLSGAAQPVKAGVEQERKSTTEANLMQPLDVTDVVLLLTIKK
jgi:hypothetical protein